MTVARQGSHPRAVAILPARLASVRLPRKVLLAEPIKALGIYTVPVKLHPEVDAEVKVWVVRE